MQRDKTIDILRGLAIFIMVGANMSALVWAEPHSFWFRIYGSFAAPFFILLSGMMVAYGKEKGKTFQHFLLRGALVVLVGILVDMAVWQIYPFMTYDVLYLIGLGLPLTYLFLQLQPKYRWFIIVILIAFTPVLQKHFGYTEYPTERYLTGELTAEVEQQTSILNHWLIDGWFPVFPWLVFSLLGGLFGEMRIKKNMLQLTKKTWMSALLLLVAGAIMWWLYPGAQYVRAGYSELFYEPTIGFVLAAVAAFVLVQLLVDKKSDAAFFRPLTLLGESALFMYILHSALIQYVLSVYWGEQSVSAFFLIYGATLITMFGIGFLLRMLKRKWQQKPYLINFILGG